MICLQDSKKNPCGSFFFWSPRNHVPRRTKSEARELVATRPGARSTNRPSRAPRVTNRGDTFFFMRTENSRHERNPHISGAVKKIRIRSTVSPNFYATIATNQTGQNRNAAIATQTSQTGKAAPTGRH